MALIPTREHSFYFPFALMKKEPNTLLSNCYFKVTHSPPHAQVKDWELLLTSSPHHESIAKTSEFNFLNVFQSVPFSPSLLLIAQSKLP